jgi:galactokinase
VVVIDFQDPAQPVVEKLAVDLAGFSHRLVIVDTGGSHADLTEDYAAIPREMRLVAQAFGMDVCRGLPLTELLTSLGRLRPKLGDRALLRALHFLEEDARVPRLAAALREGRFNDFLTLVQISGLSSHRWLQNIHPTGETREQGPDLALALVEMFLRENGGGACRIHGGGFAGTIQAWIPSGTEAALEAFLAPVLGPGRVHPLTIRQEGVCTF